MRLRLEYVGRMRPGVAPLIAKHLAGTIRSFEYTQQGILDLTVLTLEIAPTVSSNWVMNQIGSLDQTPRSIQFI